ncbi:MULTISPECIES: type IX secretion system membrane protein PorP/SprF [Flavobacterium]|uniref:Type IX secretion system membrane protein PorP/SprF n=1 Tax=Flavobacterium jumunjinense TaxID=998845 RepID=A0ABV5GQX5_9FLAO|nr:MULTISPECIES: type IX secretion system membrane protein PorP/SprF [Flavobacterium]
MKKLALFLTLCCLSQLRAQELTIPQQTQYLADNPFSMSPTFAGIGDNARIRLNGLTQWVGIKDSPINQSLALDFRIADRSGVGAYFYNDKNGNTRQYGAKFSFAQHLILDYDSEQYLSLGLSFNLNHFRLDIENFTSQNDQSVVNNRATQNYNFDIGFLYRNKDFYLSYNASNILDKNIKEVNFIEPDLLLNHQVYVGGKLRGNGSTFEIEPSALFQYFQSDGRSTTDLNLKLKKHIFEDYYWIGVTARFLNEQSMTPVTVGPMVGLRKNDFYFGYSYQINTNELLGYNSGTHMITLGFDFLQSLSNCPCTQNRIVY